MTNTKQCSRCQEHKPIESFHKDKRKTDGLSPWCKPCKNGRSSELLAEKRRDPNSEAARRHRANNAVTEAVRMGRLVKPSKCPQCGNVVDPKEMQGHHDDYDKPLDVKWMCRGCHTTEHVEERAEQLPMCPQCGTERVSGHGLKTCGNAVCVEAAVRQGGAMSARPHAGRAVETAKKMHDLMKANNWSQAELARQLNCSRSYVSVTLKENPDSGYTETDNPSILQ